MRSLFIRSLSAVLSAALVVPPTLFGYEVPLSDRSVREAYFLGQRGDEKMWQFLKDYTKALPLPKTGPHVSEITMLTLYAQVVELSRENSAGYSAQQAARDYRKRGDTVRLRVRLLFTATYTSMDAFDSARRARGPDDPEFGASQFWREFRFELRQQGNTATGTYVREEAVDSDGGLIGADVWFEYARGRCNRKK